MASVSATIWIALRGSTTSFSLSFLRTQSGANLNHTKIWSYISPNIHSKTWIMLYRTVNHVVHLQIFYILLHTCRFYCTLCESFRHQFSSTENTILVCTEPKVLFGFLQIRCCLLWWRFGFARRWRNKEAPVDRGVDSLPGDAALFVHFVFPRGEPVDAAYPVQNFRQLHHLLRGNRLKFRCFCKH